jgi:hypothetical protein
MPEPTIPEWIPVWHGRHEYLVRFTDADNRKHDWHVLSGYARNRV